MIILHSHSVYHHTHSIESAFPQAQLAQLNSASADSDGSSTLDIQEFKASPHATCALLRAVVMVIMVIPIKERASPRIVVINMVVTTNWKCCVEMLCSHTIHNIHYCLSPAHGIVNIVLLFQARIIIDYHALPHGCRAHHRSCCPPLRGFLSSCLPAARTLTRNLPLPPTLIPTLTLG